MCAQADRQARHPAGRGEGGQHLGEGAVGRGGDHHQVPSTKEFLCGTFTSLFFDILLCGCFNIFVLDRH